MKPEGNEVAPIPAPFAGLAIPVPTMATYDTVTEGKTGWRFLLTRRWIAFLVGILVYAAGCTAGVIWQSHLGAQIAEFNATVSRNFDAPAVPLDRVLPSPDAYAASDQWRPVTATGTYDVSKQVYVLNRTCGDETGFEVLTPLSMSDGRVLVVDRGCVVSSSAHPTATSSAAPPPTGRVTVTARIVAGETPKATVLPGDADEPVVGNQADSIDLRALAPRLGARVYTGAYGMLSSQHPSPANSLRSVLAGRPTLDASAQNGTIFATVLYAVVGLGIFGYALREKFRFINRFDPRLWAREWKRIQRLARKPYTDAEIEDMLVDGYAAPTIRSLKAAQKSDRP